MADVDDVHHEAAMDEELQIAHHHEAAMDVEDLHESDESGK
jgi:hypothetical protein